MSASWQRSQSITRNGVSHVATSRGWARCGAGRVSYRIRPEDVIEFRCPQCYPPLSADVKRVPSIADIIECLNEAQKELARSEPRGNWWAEVHLRDAANELAALRRLVAKMPRQA